MNASEPTGLLPRDLRMLADERARPEDELPEEDEAGLDLRAVWQLLVRNRWIIALIVGLCLLGGLAASMLTVPMYRASASIQIDQHVAKVLGTEDEESVGSMADAERYLQTQVDVLESHSLALQVADDLHLYTSKAFLDASGLDQGVAPTPEALRRAVPKALQNNLSVTLPRTSRVVTVSYASRSPDVAAQVANAFVRAFIESSLRRRFDQSAYARNFLSGQLAQAKARLEQSELSANAYARGARLIEVGQGAGAAQNAQPTSLTASDLVQLNQLYTQAKAARVQAQERWERARATPLLSLPDVLGNSAIQDLRQRRAELEATYQQERERHKEDYPAVRQAQAAMDATDRQIAAIGASVLESIQFAYQTAANQEAAFAGQVNRLKEATLSEQDRSVRLGILKRESDTNRQLYDALLQRFREVSAASGATNNNISVIDRAEAPATPYAPRPAFNLAFAGLVGMVLALAVIVVREQVDDSIRDLADTQRKLGLPLLGALPRVDDGDPMMALDNPRSPLAEASQALRTSLELSTPGGLPGTMLLTSSRQGEGKSTTAIIIARVLAQAGKRVVLIDADLRKPSLHRYLGRGNDTGLSALLVGSTTIGTAIQYDDHGLAIVTSGPLPPQPAQLLASPLFGQLMDELHRQFDHVVIDAPPVLGLADAPRLASVATGVIFVVEAHRVHRGGAKAALRRLAETRATMLGAILTKQPQSGLGGYDYYGYGTGGPSFWRKALRSD